MSPTLVHGRVRAEERGERQQAGGTGIKAGTAGRAAPA